MQKINMFWLSLYKLSQNISCYKNRNLSQKQSFQLRLVAVNIVFVSLNSYISNNGFQKL